LTTLYPFTPSPTSPFQFQPTLDGNLYTAIITWNLWGQRWYVNLYDQNNTLIFCIPLINSQATTPIGNLVWDDTGTVTVTSSAPLQCCVGTITNYTISGVYPAGYNGTFPCSILDDDTFSYPLQVDPGLVTAVGAYSIDVSMTGGYFDSTMVYRPTTGNIEVSP